MRLIFTRRKPNYERIFDAVCFVLGWCFLLIMAFAGLSLAKAEAAGADWFNFEIPYKSEPPAASSCNAQISVCQNNAASTSWKCYCVK